MLYGAIVVTFGHVTAPYKLSYYYYDYHRTLPLSPPLGAQKRKTADFRLKSHFA